MDVNRAKEIIAAEQKIDVYLDGEAVWIDSVSSASQTATVHPENRIPVESKTVRVEQLEEIR